ncbi:mast cell protease 1A-like [Pelodiscus sinensis]|uniref:mast cell protease 1A-like n=1 Tax=Pelodiscus sinensis TaxID=13735 RepID=UPI003F6CED7E
MALMIQRLVVGLLLWTFLLPPGGWAGEIIGGWEVRPHSRPYMAFLHIQRGDKIYLCGGFLVAKNFVLTAAHCQGDSITVVLGAHNIQQQERSQQVIRVRRQIPHPQYNTETLNNDIMLLQLSSNAMLTREVGLVRLTTGKHRVLPGTVCKVAGWGMTSLNTRTDTLREVNLSVVSNRLCQKRYWIYVPSTMLCLGNPKYPKSTYKGDSGSPLVCRGVAEGIVSFGAYKSITPPVGFTRISHFVPWIKANMC